MAPLTTSTTGLQPPRTFVAAPDEISVGVDAPGTLVHNEDGSFTWTLNDKQRQVPSADDFWSFVCTRYELDPSQITAKFKAQNPGLLEAQKAWLSPDKDCKVTFPERVDPVAVELVQGKAKDAPTPLDGLSVAPSAPKQEDVGDPLLRSLKQAVAPGESVMPEAMQSVKAPLDEAIAAYEPLIVELRASGDEARVAVLEQKLKAVTSAITSGDAARLPDAVTELRTSIARGGEPEPPPPQDPIVPSPEFLERATPAIAAFAKKQDSAGYGLVAKLVAACKSPEEKTELYCALAQLAREQGVTLDKTAANANPASAFFAATLVGATDEALAAAEAEAKTFTNPSMKKEYLAAIRLRRAELPGGPLEGVSDPAVRDRYKHFVGPTCDGWMKELGVSEEDVAKWMRASPGAEPPASIKQAIEDTLNGKASDASLNFLTYGLQVIAARHPSAKAVKDLQLRVLGAGAERQKAGASTLESQARGFDEKAKALEAEGKLDEAQKYRAMAKTQRDASKTTRTGLSKMYEKTIDAFPPGEAPAYARTGHTQMAAGIIRIDTDAGNAKIDNAVYWGKFAEQNNSDARTGETKLPSEFDVDAPDSPDAVIRNAHRYNPEAGNDKEFFDASNRYQQAKQQGCETLYKIRQQTGSTTGMPGTVAPYDAETMKIYEQGLDALIVQGPMLDERINYLLTQKPYTPEVVDQLLTLKSQRQRVALAERTRCHDAELQLKSPEQLETELKNANSLVFNLEKNLYGALLKNGKRRGGLEEELFQAKKKLEDASDGHKPALKDEIARLERQITSAKAELDDAKFSQTRIRSLQQHPPDLTEARATEKVFNKAGNYPDLFIPDANGKVGRDPGVRLPTDTELLDAANQSTNDVNAAVLGPGVALLDGAKPAEIVKYGKTWAGDAQYFGVQVPAARGTNNDPSAQGYDLAQKTVELATNAGTALSKLDPKSPEAQELAPVVTFATADVAGNIAPTAPDGALAVLDISVKGADIFTVDAVDPHRPDGTLKTESEINDERFQRYQLDKQLDATVQQASMFVVQGLEKASEYKIVKNDKGQWVKGPVDFDSMRKGLNKALELLNRMDPPPADAAAQRAYLNRMLHAVDALLALAAIKSDKDKQGTLDAKTQITVAHHDADTALEGAVSLFADIAIDAQPGAIDIWIASDPDIAELAKAAGYPGKPVSFGDLREQMKQKTLNKELTPLDQELLGNIEAFEQMGTLFNEAVKQKKEFGMLKLLSRGAVGDMQKIANEMGLEGKVDCDKIFSWVSSDTSGFKEIVYQGPERFKRADMDYGKHTEKLQRYSGPSTSFQEGHIHTAQQTWGQYQVEMVPVHIGVGLGELGLSLVVPGAAVRTLGTAWRFMNVGKNAMVIARIGGTIERGREAVMAIRTLRTMATAGADVVQAVKAYEQSGVIGSVIVKFYSGVALNGLNHVIMYGGKKLGIDPSSFGGKLLAFSTNFIGVNGQNKIARLTAFGQQAILPGLQFAATTYAIPAIWSDPKDQALASSIMEWGVMPMLGAMHGAHSEQKAINRTHCASGAQAVNRQLRESGFHEVNEAQLTDLMFASTKLADADAVGTHMVRIENWGKEQGMPPGAIDGLKRQSAIAYASKSLEPRDNWGQSAPTPEVIHAKYEKIVADLLTADPSMPLEVAQHTAKDLIASKISASLPQATASGATAPQSEAQKKNNEALDLASKTLLQAHALDVAAARATNDVAGVTPEAAAFVRDSLVPELMGQMRGDKTVSLDDAKAKLVDSGMSDEAASVLVNKTVDTIAGQVADSQTLIQTEGAPAATISRINYEAALIKLNVPADVAHERAAARYGLYAGVEVVNETQQFLASKQAPLLTTEQANAAAADVSNAVASYAQNGGDMSSFASSLQSKLEAGGLSEAQASAITNGVVSKLVTESAIAEANGSGPGLPRELGFSTPEQRAAFVNKSEEGMRASGRFGEPEIAASRESLVREFVLQDARKALTLEDTSLTALATRIHESAEKNKALFPELDPNALVADVALDQAIDSLMGKVTPEQMQKDPGVEKQLVKLVCEQFGLDAKDVTAAIARRKERTAEVEKTVPMEHASEAPAASAPKQRGQAPSNAMPADAPPVAPATAKQPQADARVREKPAVATKPSDGSSPQQTKTINGFVKKLGLPDTTANAFATELGPKVDGYTSKLSRATELADGSLQIEVTIVDANGDAAGSFARTLRLDEVAPGENVLRVTNDHTSVANADLDASLSKQETAFLEKTGIQTVITADMSNPADIYLRARRSEGYEFKDERQRDRMAADFIALVGKNATVTTDDGALVDLRKFKKQIELGVKNAQSPADFAEMTLQIDGVAVPVGQLILQQHTGDIAAWSGVRHVNEERRPLATGPRPEPSIPKEKAEDYPLGGKGKSESAEPTRRVAQVDTEQASTQPDQTELASTRPRANPAPVTTVPTGLKEVIADPASKGKSDPDFAWISKDTSATARLTKSGELKLVFKGPISLENRLAFVEQAVKTLGLKATDADAVIAEMKATPHYEMQESLFSLTTVVAEKPPLKISDASNPAELKAQLREAQSVWTRATEDNPKDNKFNAKCATEPSNFQNRMAEKGLYFPVHNNENGDHRFNTDGGNPPRLVIDPTFGQFFDGPKLTLADGTSQFEPFVGTYNELTGRFLEIIGKRTPCVLKHLSILIGPKDPAFPKRLFETMPTDAEAIKQLVEAYIKENWGLLKPDPKAPDNLRFEASYVKPYGAVNVPAPDSYVYPTSSQQAAAPTQAAPTQAVLPALPNDARPPAKAHPFKISEDSRWETYRSRHKGDEAKVRRAFEVSGMASQDPLFTDTRFPRIRNRKDMAADFQVATAGREYQAFVGVMEIAPWGGFNKALGTDGANDAMRAVYGTVLGAYQSSIEASGGSVSLYRDTAGRLVSLVSFPSGMSKEACAAALNQADGAAQQAADQVLQDTEINGIKLSEIKDPENETYKGGGRFVVATRPAIPGRPVFEAIDNIRAGYADQLPPKLPPAKGEQGALNKPSALEPVPFDPTKAAYPNADAGKLPGEPLILDRSVRRQEVETIAKDGGFDVKDALSDFDASETNAVDPVTGLHPATGLEPTLRNAIAWAADNGGTVIYGENDLGNLSGVTKRLSDELGVQAGRKLADAVIIRPILDAYTSRVSPVVSKFGGEVHYFRKGGDEIGEVIVLPSTLTPEQRAQAIREINLARVEAKIEVSRYVEATTIDVGGKSIELRNIEHLKHLGNADKAGSGITSAGAVIDMPTVPKDSPLYSANVDAALKDGMNRAAVRVEDKKVLPSLLKAREGIAENGGVPPDRVAMVGRALLTLELEGNTWKGLGKEAIAKKRAELREKKIALIAAHNGGDVAKARAAVEPTKENAPAPRAPDADRAPPSDAVAAPVIVRVKAFINGVTDRIADVWAGKDAPVVRIKGAGPSLKGKATDARGYALVRRDGDVAVVRGPSGSIERVPASKVVYENGLATLGSNPPLLQRMYEAHLANLSDKELLAFGKILADAQAKSPEHAMLLMRMLSFGESIDVIGSMHKWAITLPQNKLGSELSFLLTQQLDYSCAPTAFHAYLAGRDKLLARLFKRDPGLAATLQRDILTRGGGSSAPVSGSDLDPIPALTGLGDADSLALLAARPDADKLLTTHDVYDAAALDATTLAPTLEALAASKQTPIVLTLANAKDGTVSVEITGSVGGKLTVVENGVTRVVTMTELLGDRVMVGVLVPKGVVLRAAGRGMVLVDEPYFQRSMVRGTGLPYETIEASSLGPVALVDEMHHFAAEGYPVFVIVEWDGGGRHLLHIVDVREVAGKPGTYEYEVFDPGTPGTRWLPRETFASDASNYDGQGRVAGLLLPKELKPLPVSVGVDAAQRGSESERRARIALGDSTGEWTNLYLQIERFRSAVPGVAQAADLAIAQTDPETARLAILAVTRGDHVQVLAILAEPNLTLRRQKLHTLLDVLNERAAIKDLQKLPAGLVDTLIANAGYCSSSEMRLVFSALAGSDPKLASAVAALRKAMGPHEIFAAFKTLAEAARALSLDPTNRGFWNERARSGQLPAEAVQPWIDAMIRLERSTKQHTGQLAAEAQRDIGVLNAMLTMPAAEAAKAWQAYIKQAGVSAPDQQVAVNTFIAEVKNGAIPNFMGAETGPAVATGLSAYVREQGKIDLNAVSDVRNVSFKKMPEDDAFAKSYSAQILAKNKPLDVVPTIDRPDRFVPGNSTELTWYKTKDGRLIGFKPQGTGPGNEGARTEIATSKLNDALGLSCVGGIKAGVIDGKPGAVIEVIPDGFIPAQADEKGAISGEKYAAARSDLQVFDYLCAASDRHTNNVRIRPGKDGAPNEMMAIDHSGAFTAGVLPPKVSLYKLSGGMLPATYTPKMVEAIAKMTPERLRETLSADLTPTEIEGAVARLYIIKADIADFQAHPDRTQSAIVEVTP